MNINNFFKELFEDRLGLDTMGLEREYKSLVEFINKTTLPTFSSYVGFLYRYRLDVEDSSLHVNGSDQYARGHEYYIKDPFIDYFNLEIFDIHKVDLSRENLSIFNRSTFSGYTNINLSDVLLGSLNTEMQSNMRSALPLRPHYEKVGPNVLRLENYPTMGTLEIVLRTTYPNIQSIPDQYKELFMSLCKLDIKTKLYNQLKYLEDVVTPAGNLNLKISDWEQADSQRDDFLKDLKARTLSDRLGDSVQLVF